MQLPETPSLTVSKPLSFKKALETATCNTAVFVNRGFGGPAIVETRTLTRTISGLSLRSHREPVVQPVADRSHHIYFPFFGGVDDRVALRFVLQLAQNSNITATIIHFIIPLQSPIASRSPEVNTEASRATNGLNASQLEITERVDTEALYANAAQDTALLHTLRDSLPQPLSNRVVFVDVPTTKPVSDCLSHARQEVAQSPRNAGDLIIVGRGKQHNTALSFELDIGSSSSVAERRKTVGIVAESIISGGVRGSVLVIQAGGNGLDI